MTQSNKKLEFNIVKDIFSIWLLVVIILSATFGLMYGLIGIYSTLLGSVFSLLGLRQLSEDQYSILMSQNRKKVFISYILRLFIYAIPIIIALKFSNYFKFWIILICLFKSQVIFISKELFINYKNYKKRMAKNGQNR